MPRAGKRSPPNSSEYSKKSFENGSAFFEKLLGAKSFESAIQIQSEYTKTFLEELGEYVTKTSELYANLAKEVFKPIETFNANDARKSRL